MGSVRSSRNANVRLSVFPMKSVLELRIFIFLTQVSLQDGLRSLSSYFIGHTEPKILCLVNLSEHIMGIMRHGTVMTRPQWLPYD